MDALLEVVTREARIEIASGVRIRGGNVELSAKAGDEAPEDIATGDLKIFSDYTIGSFTKLVTQSISWPLVLMFKSADARVIIGEGTQISGSGSVHVEADARADATAEAITGGCSRGCRFGFSAPSTAPPMQRPKPWLART